ncbi:SRPBCC domain-containing protein [Hoyosella sp. G463]|uniref:SRPBCC domain-containing protein n=1 Tax=Lolliginicoccus lacisalsi TaxID=2742202 RepID=A0A927JEJ3_9ACTN|nr:SRPBCC domain-containing protein [Lolliginicoccus lacisalsi]MBD8507152.1 SRPBCC domain-containing protein [Lolliginicoccus lacisalsi]
MRIILTTSIAFATIVAAAAGSYLYTVIAKPGIETAITIDAPPEAVWATLTDFESYEQWNPFITSSAGTATTGTRLRNTIDNNGSAMTFEPRITVAEPARELRWIGRFLAPGIVDGEHYFLLEALPGGQTRLVQGEQFRGALVPLAGNSLDVRDSFDAMNRALRERSEQQAAR